jgi:hypothetical protein
MIVDDVFYGKPGLGRKVGKRSIILRPESRFDQEFLPADLVCDVTCNF